MKRDYDSTIARMAGNIAAGFDVPATAGAETRQMIAEYSVDLSLRIVDEVIRRQKLAADAKP